CQQYENFPF
nr:immunoglobulin light chain junction region [Macaca mulatta]